MNRSNRATLAQKTLEILQQGYYVNDRGIKIDFQTEYHYALENTQHYTPEALEDLIINYENNANTIITVTEETTLQAAYRLIALENKTQTLALNFASAKNPGGGFLGGSQAQEESLARSSGLYPCISQKQAMYTYNKKNYSKGYYSDHMLYSPKVPVLRNDNGELLEKPYLCSIITAPAVNAGVVNKDKQNHQEEIYTVMFKRTEKVLNLAVYYQQKHLILGAWGCGVFQNNPAIIAKIFYQHLAVGKFANAFESIVFAIKSKGDIFEVFQRQFL